MHFSDFMMHLCDKSIQVTTRRCVAFVSLVALAHFFPLRPLYKSKKSVQDIPDFPDVGSYMEIRETTKIELSC